MYFPSINKVKPKASKPFFGYHTILMPQTLPCYLKIKCNAQTLQMLRRSIYFLNNTRQFLANWVELGHDTCHRTHGYDAEKCHQDCKEREKSVFAKDCETKGGLFKCCIRQYPFLKPHMTVFVERHGFVGQFGQSVLQTGQQSDLCK